MLQMFNQLKAEVGGVESEVGCREFDEVFFVRAAAVKADGEHSESFMVQGYEGEIFPFTFEGS